MIGSMLGHWTYLVTTIFVCAIIIIGVELFHKNTIREEWRIFALAIIVGLIQGIPMSHYAITMDAYHFGEEFILGNMIIVSPVEDIIFAIGVPAFIAAVTIYFYHHPPKSEHTFKNRVLNRN